MHKPHAHSGKCSCCSMSRRCFIATSGLAMAASVAGASKRERDPEGIGEYVDLAGLRPRPPVRLMSAFVRHKPPYWLGWPGTTYDVEGHRAEYARQFAREAARIGVTLEQEADPLENDDAVNAFVAKVQAERPDGVLVSLQHMGAWHWTDAVTKAGVPTIIFAPIGTAFTGHVQGISRRPGVHVVSSLEMPAVTQAFRMIRAKRQLEESRVLVVAGDRRNETVLERLGAKVRYVPRPMLHELFARMPANDEAHAVAGRFRRRAKKSVEPTRDDGLNAARSYMTAKRLMRDERANAITTDCLGMVSQKVVPTPPCMAASLFQDAGVTYGCEADLFAAVSLMFVSYLFDKPGFMQDPVPDTARNLFVGAHCTSGTRLKGFDEPPEPLILRSHSESDLGVATQVLWREDQPVTFVRFKDPNSLILDSGTVVGNVNTPPAGGCRTSVEIAMDRIEDVRDVQGFHQVIFYGDHRRDVEAFCQMYGIGITNSPERAPRRTQA